MEPLEFLELIIREVRPWQWILMSILSITGFIIIYFINKDNKKPTKKRILTTTTLSYEFSTPNQSQGDKPEPVQVNSTHSEDDEKSDESPTTSLGEELYNKKFGLILLFVCWVWRYPIGIHFPDLWIKSAWQFHSAMGVLVLSIWLYGMLRHNKRSYVDHAVNFLLGLWGILLFLVEGELTL